MVPADLNRALARVNLAAIERNTTRMTRALANGAALCAIVKSDGYGHGAVQAGRAALAGGASWLGVATAGEAHALREAGIDARLLVMGALTAPEIALAIDADADVVVWREASVGALVAAAGPTPVRVHVKLDTGMGRLGTRSVDEARRVVDAAAAAPELELAGVMTHFATADELGDAFFHEQLESFVPFAEEVKRAHPQAIAHAANSAAVLRDPASHLDLARVGIAIYGMDPFQRDPADHGLEPALALGSYVAEVKAAAPGQSAGYGRAWIAAEDTAVATLPIGYGDGVRRALSNNAEVLIGAVRHPLVGTVSMDNITVDVGASAGAKPYGEAVLIGEQGAERILAEEWARRLDTINYEITCGLTQRVQREYHRDGV